MEINSDEDIPYPVVGDKVYITVKDTEQEKKDKDLLTQILPPQCGGVNQIHPPESTPYREPEPTRVLHPEECFRPCPRIIRRDQWGARLPTVYAEQMMYRVRSSVFKQSDSHNCSDLFSCTQNVKLLQMYQMDYLGYTDIAYNFMIGEDGNIYEGRGWGVECEKATGFLGIGFLGYYTDEGVTRPSDSMLQLAYDLIMCGVRKGFLANPFKLFPNDMTPVEKMRDLIQCEEDINYKAKVEDTEVY